MDNHDIIELKRWDERIRKKADEFGLSCYPQDFEICDFKQMLGYMAYSGMPSHYPHWSYGKAYEKLKTLYDYGVSGLPYEMVINSNPALAYLMRDNTLTLKILTMAHVYGHNDFFKNNAGFSKTRSELTINMFKIHAQRIESYIEDPSIGIDRVENIIDAAHSISLQCNRNVLMRTETRKEQKERLIDAARPVSDPFQRIHGRQDYKEPDLHKIPLEPEENLLLFIRDYNPRLEEWQRDILTIIHEQTQYFIPQIETKIMNEGWASYWHREILNAIELPQELHLEFLVRHNQVVRPLPWNSGLNPYHLGLKVWDYIRRRWDEPTPEEVEKYGKPEKGGREKIFETREVDRDSSFLRRFLTEELIRELRAFQFEEKGDDIVVTHVADADDWRVIKETIIRNVGMGSVPVIKIEDADGLKNRTLVLKHYHEGRDLDMEHVEKTLFYTQTLWGHAVQLETLVNNVKKVYSVNENGKFSS